MSQQQSRRENLIYLVSALVDKSGKVLPNSAQPIANTFIALKDPDRKVLTDYQYDESGSVIEVKTLDQPLQVYLTDDLGVIRNFVSGKPKETIDAEKLDPFKLGPNLHAISKESKLFYPPSRLLMYHLAVDGLDNWIDQLRDSLNAILQDHAGIALGNQITGSGNAKYTLDVKKLFKTPVETANSVQEIAYKQWHQKQIDSMPTLRALVIPRVKAICIAFSSKDYEGAEVCIRDRDGKLVFYSEAIIDPAAPTDSSQLAKVKAIRDDQSDKIIGYGTLLYDALGRHESKVDSHKQIYQIEVKLSRLGAENLGIKERTYKLAERIRFDIKNIAGEFELINGDAISLEEVMVKQFPYHYRHIMEKAANSEQSLMPLTAPPAGGSKNPYEAFMHGIAVQAGRAKMIGGILGADSGQALDRKLGKFIFDSLTDVNNIKLGDVTLGDVVNIGFSVFDNSNEIAGKIDKLKNGTLHNPEIPRTAAELNAVLNNSRAVKAMEQLADRTGRTYDQLVDHFLGAGHAPINLAPRFRRLLEKSQGFVEKYGDAIGTAADLFALADNAVTTGVKYNSYSDTRAKFTSVLQDYAWKMQMTTDEQAVDQNFMGTVQQQLNQLKQKFGQRFQVKQIDNVFLVNVVFAFDKSEFQPDNTLTDFVETVKSIAGEIHLTLKGYTCVIGSTEYNQGLSIRRANAVKQSMVDRGIEKGAATIKWSTLGMGESTTYSEKSKNRRVEAELAVKAVKQYLPSREGMDVLEKFRALTSYNYAELDDAMVKTIVSAIDVALGLAWKVNPYLAVAAILWQVGGLIKDVAAFSEKLLFGNDFLDLLDKYKKEGTNSFSNHVLLLKGQSDDETIDGSDYLEYQSRLRAEALYGLVRLLIRCSSESGSAWQRGRASMVMDIFNDGRKEFSYQENIKHYRVEEYINRVVLSDGWKITSNLLSPQTLDEYWVQMIHEGVLDEIINDPNTGVIERQTKAMEKMLGIEIELRDLLIGGPSYLASQLLLEALSDLKKSVIDNPNMTFDYIRFSYFSNNPDYDDDMRTAAFQKMFPIHYRASEKIEEFAGHMALDFSGIDKKAYAVRSISARKIGTLNQSGWTSLHKWITGAAGDHKTVTPADQIRICIILDSEKHDAVKRMIEDGSIFQLSVQAYPERRDGYNRQGPPVSGFIKKINYQNDLTADERNAIEAKNLDVNNLYGAILYPSYQFGAQKIHGTKPMASDFSAWFGLNSSGSTNTLFNLDGKWDMTYAYVTVLAYRESSKSPIEFHNGEDEFPYSIDSKREHALPGKGAPPFKESLLLDKHFLQVEKEVEPHPRLFKENDGDDGQTLVFCLIRNKKTGEYYFPDDAWKTVKSGMDLHPGDIGQMINDITYDHARLAVIKDFKWDDPVELIVLISSEEIDIKAYEDRHLTWKSIGGHVQLQKVGHVGLMGADTSMLNFLAGPTYETTFNYIGDLVEDKSKLNFYWKVKPEALYYGLKKAFENEDILSLFSGLNPASTKIGEAFRHNFVDLVRPLYAAHIDLKYQSITGYERKGLKPFRADPDGSWESNWNLAFKVHTEGDSGLKGDLAQGMYSLPYPTGFDKPDACWYKAIQSDVDNAKKLVQENKKISLANAASHEFDALIRKTPLVQWELLNESGKPFWHDEREEHVKKWLTDQAEKRYLPSGDLLVMEDAKEAVKELE